MQNQYEKMEQRILMSIEKRTGGESTGDNYYPGSASIKPPQSAMLLSDDDHPIRNT